MYNIYFSDKHICSRRYREFSNLHNQVCLLTKDSCNSKSYNFIVSVVFVYKYIIGRKGSIVKEAIKVHVIDV